MPQNKTYFIDHQPSSENNHLISVVKDSGDIGAPLAYSASNTTCNLIWFHQLVPLVHLMLGYQYSFIKKK